MIPYLSCVVWRGLCGRMSRAAVLQSYAQLLRLASRLPAADAADARVRIRASYRAAAGAAPDRLPGLLEQAERRAAYLRMVTPRVHGGAAPRAAAGARGGRTRYVVTAGGDLVEAEEGPGGAAGRPTVKGAGLDPADVKRHAANLQRFRFGGRT